MFLGVSALGAWAVLCFRDCVGVSISVCVVGVVTVFVPCTCGKMLLASQYWHQNPAPTWPLELDLRQCPTFQVGCSAVLLCLGLTGSPDAVLSVLKLEQSQKNRAIVPPPSRHRREKAKVNGSAGIREGRMAD